MDQGRGHCLCGAVSYEFTGPPNWQAHCHCESCRRNCSAPFTSFFGIDNGKWRWTGAVPAVFSSSPGVKRHFCAVCGTPMAFESDQFPHERHFYAASLDEPADYQPQQHVHYNEHVPWLHLDDGLPCRRTPRRMVHTEDFAPLLALIQSGFAYMNARIDPPSSATRLTLGDIGRQAEDGEIWVLEDLGQPIACAFLSRREACLYLGKLAVVEGFRNQGLARQLVQLAANRAKKFGLPEVVLETRVELTENHAAFRAMGFELTGENAHPGFDRPTSLLFTLKVN